MVDEVFRWSAVEMAAAVRRREISSRELVNVALARLEELHPISNAFSEVFEFEARRDAQAADDATARGVSLGPLHGVPVAWKDNHDVAGRPTTQGSPVLAEVAPPAEEDAPPVARYRRAGAVGIGRTRMPPFGMRWTTESEFFGPTRNPWDPYVTAGASSGGAAVAVATGIVPIAQGNDIGGSVRYPASVNGVIGLRPTVGRVPWWDAPQNAGMRLVQRQFQVDGPIARTVADLRIALAVTAGHDYRDPESIPATVAARPVQGRPRIGVVVEPSGGEFANPCSPEAKAALIEAAGRLSDEGYDVAEVAVPELGQAADLWWKLALIDFQSGGLGDAIDHFADAGMRAAWTSVTARFAERFGELGVKGLLDAWAHRTAVRRSLARRMESVPILLTAASSRSPFALGDDVATPNAKFELGKDQWPNMAIPVLALPAVGMGVTAPRGRAPLGVQIVGRAWDEDGVLSVAEVLERRRDIVTPIDPVAPAEH